VLAMLTDVGFGKLERASLVHVGSVRAALVDVVDDEDLLAVGRAFAAVADMLETGPPDPVLSPKLPHPGTSDSLQPA
jgi:hypothetical protein